MATAPGEVTRCGLDTSLDPRPVLLKGVAEGFRFAREGQARRRGSPRQPCGDQHPMFWSRSGRPSNAQGSGNQAYRLLCVRRRTVCTLPERYLRLLPLVASEATGAPGALLSPRRNGGRSKAVWRGHLSYTAWMAFLYNACPRTNGMLSRAQRSASPSQVKSPFDADDHICLVGRDSLQKRCWARWQVPVEKHLSTLVEDTEIHGAGMQIEAAVTLMLLSVEAPEVSSVPS
jgi:hypothetical protein